MPKGTLKDDSALTQRSDSLKVGFEVTYLLGEGVTSDQGADESLQYC
jgi:hypothetical protein